MRLDAPLVEISGISNSQQITWSGATGAAGPVAIALVGIGEGLDGIRFQAGLLERAQVAGRTVTLTDVGAAVLPLARAALLSVESARRTVEEMAGLEVLAESWRALARRRLESGRIEDWRRRLGG